MYESVILLLLVLGVETEAPDSPDAEVTQSKVQALEGDQKAITKLLGDLKAYAVPLSKKQDGQKFEDAVEANINRAVGRAIVLCKLQAALSRAMDNRLALEGEKDRYEAWLAFARSSVSNAEQQLDPREIAKEKLRLQSRWKVLAELERNRLAKSLASLAPGSKEVKEAETRIAELRTAIGEYEFVPFRAEYEAEYIAGYTAAQQREERHAIVRRYREKQKEFQAATEGVSGEFSREDLLEERHILALNRADELLKETAQLSEQAKIVAANSIHLARVLDLIESKLQVLDKNIVLLKEIQTDAKFVANLETLFSAEQRPRTSDDDLNEVIELFEN